MIYLRKVCWTHQNWDLLSKSSTRKPAENEGLRLSWQSARLACAEPCGHSPAPHELGVVAHTCNLSTGEVEARGSEIQVILGTGDLTS